MPIPWCTAQLLYNGTPYYLVVSKQSRGSTCTRMQLRAFNCPPQTKSSANWPSQVSSYSTRQRHATFSASRKKKQLKNIPSNCIPSLRKPGAKTSTERCMQQWSKLCSISQIQTILNQMRSPNSNSYELIKKKLRKWCHPRTPTLIFFRFSSLSNIIFLHKIQTYLHPKNYLGAEIKCTVLRWPILMRKDKFRLGG